MYPLLSLFVLHQLLYKTKLVPLPTRTFPNSFILQIQYRCTTTPNAYCVQRLTSMFTMWLVGISTQFAPLHGENSFIPDHFYTVVACSSLRDQ